MARDISTHDERVLVLKTFTRVEENSELIAAAVKIDEEMHLDFWGVYSEHRDWLHADDRLPGEPMADDEIHAMKTLTDEFRGKL